MSYSPITSLCFVYKRQMVKWWPADFLIFFDSEISYLHHTTRQHPFNYILGSSTQNNILFLVKDNFFFFPCRQIPFMCFTVYLEKCSFLLTMFTMHRSSEPQHRLKSNTTRPPPEGVRVRFVSQGSKFSSSDYTDAKNIESLLQVYFEGWKWPRIEPCASIAHLMHA